MTDGPKMLVIDIETAPSMSLHWGLFKQNIAVSQVVKPGYMLCYAAKWLDSEDMLFSRVETQEQKQELWNLLDEADALVHYNGKSFDNKWINTTLARAGFTPPAPCLHVDLLTVVRQNFKLLSNKLEFVAPYFGLAGKAETGGMQLWIDVMDGNYAAWATMEAYNKQDVVVTEELYHFLLPWINNHPNYALFSDQLELDDKPICPNCGSQRMESKGWAYTKVRKYRRYQCRDCGKQTRARVQYDKETGQVVTGIAT